MGAIVSSKQDYNHTLARQPRKSIRLTQFQVPDHIRQPPLSNSLSIPKPVHKTENSTVETKPVAKESIKDQSVHTNANMNRNPVILSRSIQNINKDNNQMNNLNRSIIEHNGKRFLTELNHRMERRYVQVYDDKINQMRFFEVTDFIPCRTIRSFRVHPQTNGFSRQPLRSNVIQRRESTKSNLLNFEDLRNRDRLNREFDSYHNGVSLSTTNLNNPQPTSPPKIPLVTQNSMDSTYMYSKPEPYKPLSTDSRRTQTQYQAPSFREHSPTTSEYSRTETEENSMISYAEDEEDDDYTDSEGMDPMFPSNRRESINSRNNDRLSYRSLGGHGSFTDFDPFKKKVNPRDSVYRTPDSLKNYSQPMTNNRRNPISVASDYAPITVNRNQTDQKAHAYRRDSYNYDG